MAGETVKKMQRYEAVGSAMEEISLQKWGRYIYKIIFDTPPPPRTDPPTRVECIVLSLRLKAGYEPSMGAYMGAFGSIKAYLGRESGCSQGR